MMMQKQNTFYRFLLIRLQGRRKEAPAYTTTNPGHLLQVRFIPDAWGSQWRWSFHESGVYPRNLGTTSAFLGEKLKCSWRRCVWSIQFAIPPVRISTIATSNFFRELCRLIGPILKETQWYRTADVCCLLEPLRNRSYITLLFGRHYTKIRTWTGWRSPRPLATRSPLSFVYTAELHCKSILDHDFSPLGSDSLYDPCPHLNSQFAGWTVCTAISRGSRRLTEIVKLTKAKLLEVCTKQRRKITVSCSFGRVLQISFGVVRDTISMHHITHTVVKRKTFRFFQSIL